MFEEHRCLFFISWIILLLIFKNTDAQEDWDGNPDAERLFNAVTADPFDRKPFLEILPKRTCEQRSKIAICYAKKFGRFIVEDIKEEPTFYNAEKLLIQASFFCNAEFYAFMMRQYFDFDTAFRRRQFTDISVKAAVDPALKAAIIENFNYLNNKDVDYMTKKKLDGDYKSIMREIWVSDDMQRNTEEPPDPDVASQIADDILSEQKDWKDKREKLDKGLLTHSIPLTRLVLEKFAEKSRKELHDAVKANRDEDSGDAYQCLYEIIKEPYKYLARRWIAASEHADQGFLFLIQLILPHLETDIQKIGDEYETMKEIDVIEEFERKIPEGFFRDLLLAYMTARKCC